MKKLTPQQQKAIKGGVSEILCRRGCNPHMSECPVGTYFWNCEPFMACVEACLNGDLP